GKRLGPFGRDELAARLIDARTPIWKQGMAQWARAGEVPELKELLAELPPPLPSESQPAAAEQPPSRKQPATSRKGYQPSRATVFGRGLAAAIAAAISILLAILLYAQFGVHLRSLWHTMSHPTQRQAPRPSQA